MGLTQEEKEAQALEAAKKVDAQAEVEAQGQDAPGQTLPDDRHSAIE